MLDQALSNHYVCGMQIDLTAKTNAVVEFVLPRESGREISPTSSLYGVWFVKRRGLVVK
jgi:hypothetical protein